MLGIYLLSTIFSFKWFHLFSPEKKDLIMEQSLEQNSINEFGQPIIKRQRMTPPLNERVMLYVRQSNEDVYTPLHVVPPTAIGLLNAVSAAQCLTST